MSSTASVIKTLVIPAAISLTLYLLLTYLIVPFWRHYRQRYGQYLPLESISTRADGLRDRIQDGIANLMFNPPWRRSRGDPVVAADGIAEDNDGEELGGVSEERRSQLARSAQNTRPDNTRRLSRDLEEGFMDDSDEDSDSDEDDTQYPGNARRR